MKKSHINAPVWAIIGMLALTACENLSAGGNVGIVGIVSVLVIVGLAWLAIKLLGGVLKTGIWAVVLLIILFVGFIGWIILESME